MARHRKADLVLDTWPCGGHTTAVEALSCGVPMITKIGRTFASRVGASVLTAADMPELIAHDLEAYENMAVEIANSPTRHVELKAKLAASRRASALFDSALHRRSLEAAYQEMWRRFKSGQTVESFDID
jgi:predicted O-linked N-acetylglucosamine transferase (SPINDLY family)